MTKVVKRTALSKVRTQLTIAEEHIKQQVLDLKSLDETLQATKKAFCEKCEAVRMAEAQVKQLTNELASRRDSENNYRRHIHQQEIKTARLEGYLTRANEKLKDPRDSDPTRLVEIPRWLAAQNFSNYQTKVGNNGACRGYSNSILSEGKPEEPEWFTL